ncbi:disulfide bond formation protein B [Granulosicoccaceae sp. 1_MG-2023]|nr:disulfide bond formation protein B [Granulosicoccaceae sp. 1_MG-2023]
MRRSRAVFGLGFLGCASALLIAIFYFQRTLGLAPCPLCVIQRVIFIVLGLVFLLATLHNPQGVMRRVYAGLATLTALAGAGVSGWHVRLQNLPPDQVPECGPGLDFMLEVMPLQQVLTEIFTGSGECSEVVWSLLGLSIPAWTAIAFLAFAAYSLWLLLARR